MRRRLDNQVRQVDSEDTGQDRRRARDEFNDTAELGLQSSLKRRTEEALRDFRNSDYFDEISRKLVITMPKEAVLEKLYKLHEANPALAQQIIKVIKSIYYLPIDRPNTNTRNISILSTQVIENEYDVRVGDKDHSVKTYGVYRQVRKLLQAISTEIRRHNERSEVHNQLQTWHDYMSCHNELLKAVVNGMQDEKKQKLRETQGFVDQSPAKLLSKKNKDAITELHPSPSVVTPRKTRETSASVRRVKSLTSIFARPHRLFQGDQIRTHSDSSAKISEYSATSSDLFLFTAPHK